MGSCIMKQHEEMDEDMHKGMDEDMQTCTRQTGDAFDMEPRRHAAITRAGRKEKTERRRIRQ